MHQDYNESSANSKFSQYSVVQGLNHENKLSLLDIEKYKELCLFFA